jgi:Protein of unknown function (DUF3293)
LSVSKAPRPVGRQPIEEDSDGESVARLICWGSDLYSRMMIDPRLLQAFRKTRFIASTPVGELILRVGEENHELDHLLASFGAMCCAFVTAWNPGAARLSDEENTVRQNALVTGVQASGFQFFLGRGVGEEGNWPPEESILIVGIGRTSALEIARRHGQLAVVFAKYGEPVELLLCR